MHWYVQLMERLGSQGPGIQPRRHRDTRLEEAAARYATKLFNLRGYHNISTSYPFDWLRCVWTQPGSAMQACMLLIFLRAGDIMRLCKKAFVARGYLLIEHVEGDGHGASYRHRVQ